jgi:hypothetical protein
MCLFKRNIVTGVPKNRSALTFGGKKWSPDSKDVGGRRQIWLPFSSVENSRSELRSCQMGSNMANIAMHVMLATCWATATGPAASHLTHAVSLKRVNTNPLWASSGRRTCDFQKVSMYCTAEFSLRNTFPALYLHMQHRARLAARWL